MDYLKKFNESNEEIKSITNIDLFHDFFYNIIDVIESLGGSDKDIGFIWNNKDIYTDIDNYRFYGSEYDNIYDEIISMSRDKFNNEVESGKLKLIFLANFKFIGNSTKSNKLSTFLDKIKKLTLLEELNSSLGDRFDSISIKPQAETQNQFILYAVVNAKETIEIGNKIQRRDINRWIK